MIEDEVRTRLQDAPTPAALVPPPDLLARVTRGNRRRRVRMTLAAVAAAIVAVAVPVVARPGVETDDSADGIARIEAAPWLPTPPEEPSKPPMSDEPADPPEPGGGPMVIASYVEANAETQTHYLLDIDAGKYVAVPDRVVLSPDLDRVLIMRADHLGVAQLDDYLADGIAAVHWFTDGWRSRALQWSPDGSKIYWDEIAGETRVLDISKETITTLTPPDGYGKAEVAWNADSASMLFIRADEDEGTSAVLTLGLDGRSRGVLTVAALVHQPIWSPDGTEALIREFSAAEDDLRLTVRDTFDWTLLADVTGALITDGPDRFSWYDDTSVIRVTEREPWNGETFVDVIGLDGATITDSFSTGHINIDSFGPSGDLPGPARELGF
ncbi:hypothetical protein [Phytomonospora endophytica]|uniref:WD40 repeat domain-containing protein n=1 Tax=Phytomonospora endophytica TaxID=714109 RepID=A0A841FQ05_9ACTN|nr:hypothetical protein [Phytomonospora endophytica]MBB6037914.1 hypothetical protein [Phytomonospora endophytica]GIG68814.1 hypothetical protein Pen01_51090 [Phytomonospora endophytica]